MPALPILAGGRILASVMQSIAPLAVIKGADQTVATTTLQNDNALFLTGLVANATYMFESYLNYEGGTGGSSDLQWVWAVPASATLRYQGVYQGAGTNSAIVNATLTGATTATARTGGSGFLCGATMNGTLFMSSTPGTIQLKWAANSAAVSTTVHAQSYLALWRVS
jgi:hypothetical protein